MKLADLLQAVREEGDDQPEHSMTRHEQAEVLQDIAQRYLAAHEFKPGDLVQAKSGLADMKYPRGVHPAVVVEVFPAPIGMWDASHYGRPSYGDVATMRIMTLYKDGTVITLAVDGARFEPFRA